jgi:hypothetical protein
LDRSQKDLKFQKLGPLPEYQLSKMDIIVLLNFEKPGLGAFQYALKINF